MKSSFTPVSKAILSFFFFYILSFSLQAQDTLRLMAYNILNYTSTDANATRYLDLRTIVAYFKPDMLICSELVDGSGAQRLLDSSFNVNGVNYYSRAVFSNGPDTDNMLFYNSQKIKLKSQNQIATNLRDITRYRVYHVISTGDTAYLNLFSAHLKAGNLPSDAASRLSEITDFCTYITAIPQSENLIIGGDFNIYADTEQVWNYVTTSSCSHVFYDPINSTGLWNNNSVFAAVHTQSNRSVTNPGCCGGATGGLDDRFDFLLANSRVINGGSKIQYIPGSYKSCGNDGNHFNKSIIELPVNSSVPAAVNTALFNMSDHLPVMLELEVGSTLGINEYTSNSELSINQSLNNSGSNELCLFSNIDREINLGIYDVTGRLLAEHKVSLSKGKNNLDVSGWMLPSGIFIAQVKMQDQIKTAALFRNF